MGGRAAYDRLLDAMIAFHNLLVKDCYSCKADRLAARFSQRLCYVAAPGVYCQINRASLMGEILDNKTFACNSNDGYIVYPEFYFTSSQE